MLNLQEFYSVIGEDYNEVLSRLPSEKLLMKVLKMYLSDPSYDSLCQSFAKGLIKDSFNAVHSLKGVAGNLGFSALAQKSSVLCEALRHADVMPDKKLFDEVVEAHQKVVKALAELFSDKLND